MKTFHVMPYRQLFALLTIGFGSVCITHAEATSSSTTPQVGSTSAGVQSEATTDENVLDKIPRWVDATPTIFPEQSNHSIVPPTEQTEDQTWVDRKQKKIRNWADRTSEKIDDWFGEVDPQKPATATIRVMVDNYWNEYDNYEIKPRIRGKIKLPTLEKRLSVVFGDDSLDDEFNNSPANINQNPNQDPNKKLDGKRTRDDNSSIALRWSNFSKKLPFETDADLGIRSGDDIYVRLKASRDWQLRNDFKFYAEQIYRYGIDSENYLRTNLELTHARPNQPFLSNQFSLTYADDQDDDLAWENRTFREHHFFANNRFNYGIYTGGYYKDNDLRLNSWGPFVSWRQPVLREWFFVQGDVNYFNDHREDRNHFVSTFLRLEALF
ncbi:hypothetical protein AWW73_02660 [Acinetobacter lactucae]|uniref:hypothetical protein n=1 Tax=Acinetobacter lactucae TaxID=1785128 RepID=UPI0007A0AA83|nr:hypothetical protein [Acinetobacter lactucae]KYQ80021.1 hypothetical protein AWW73_02660 [Acinetobacter lactucae]